MRYTHSKASPAVKCDVIVGTRPEAIKLAPVIKALRESGDDFLVRVVTSGQHGEICRSALATFGLVADSELDIEPISGSLADSAGNVLRAFGRRFADSRPDLIIVQGDTTTAMAAALAGFYAQIPIVHVEAGLRSGDLAHPFPEEANRQIIDAVSEILLPPTPQAQSNLQRAGFPVERCPVTGNTVVDALQLLCATHPPVLDGSGLEEAELEGRRLILVTTHRRESWGGDLEAICSAIREIVQRSANVIVALPVHPNPNVQRPVCQLLGGHPRIKLLPPLNYIPFLALMRRAYLILTDSGGVQEEAPSLGVPVLVLRKTTERPEAAEAGLARVIGTDRRAIVEHVEDLLEDERAYRRMASAVNPYGDGLASERIVEVLKNWRAGRPLLVEERSFSPRPRLTTSPQDLQKRSPTAAQDIGLFLTQCVWAGLCGLVLHRQPRNRLFHRRKSMTGRTRRQFLAVTGVTLAAALATNLARAQLAGQGVTTRLPSKVGVAPGYIVSGRGEHSSNPYFVPQGKPSNKHMPRPQAVHGKGVMEEDTP